MKKTLAILVLGLVAFLALGCGGSSVGGGGGGGTGRLAVHLADAPDPTITAVDITIDSVSAHINGSWETLASTQQTVNLLDLVSNDMVIGTAIVPAGAYTQVRLVVSDGSVTDSTGTHKLVIPSGLQTGIKVNLNFTVDPNVLTEVLLDFNVQKSIVRQGNGTYLLKPVIPATIKVVSGTVTGTATDGTNPLEGATVKAVYKAGPNYPVDTVVNETVTLSDGTFKVWALKAGTYELQLSWTNPADALIIKTATVADVVVVAQQNTDVGSIALL